MKLLRTLLIKLRLLFTPEGSMIVAAICKLMEKSPELFVLTIEHEEGSLPVIFIQAQGQIHFDEARLIQASRIRISQHEILLDTPSEQGVHLNPRDTYLLMNTVQRLLRSSKLKVV